MDEEKMKNEFDQLKKMIGALQSASKKYFSIEEAAEYIGISKSTLYKHTAGGQIPFYKPNGKLITFSKDDLDKWLLKTRIPSNEELRASF